jgi:hypothetical protein
MVIHFIRPSYVVKETTDKIAIHATIDTASLIELFKIGCGTIQVMPEMNLLDKKYYYIIPKFIGMDIEGDYNADEMQYLCKAKNSSVEQVQWLMAIFMTVHSYTNMLSLGVDPLKCNNILTENKRVDIIYTATKEQWLNIFKYSKNELVNMRLQELCGSSILEEAEKHMKFNGLLK